VKTRIWYAEGKGEKAGTGAKGGLCRAEGAEVPVFSWGGVFS